MDPYLENPALWPDVHHRLLSVTAELLGQQLRPNHYARIRGPGELISATGEGATGASPAETLIPVEDEILRAPIEVIARQDRSAVTVIEFLSPGTKTPGSGSREGYEKRRLAVMHSPIHFVEIDLLRNGERFALHAPLPAHEYGVVLYRVERRHSVYAWPTRLEELLPTIPVPLRGDDPDARLDLQEIVQRVYDRAAYELQIDYRAEPVPPLSPQHTRWADELLRAKGLR
jgi:hypothetical protein